MMSRSLVAKADPVSAVSLPCRMRHDVLRQDSESVRSLVGRTGFFTIDEVEIAVELVEAHLSDGPASGYQFVFAELDGAVAGYACYGPIPCTAASYDLYWIAVEPKYQRHGVGRMLMDVVESQVAAHGGERIYIDTSGRDQYAPTRAFYERNGFHAEARLKDFYAPGDDRVIYAKSRLKSR